jgi:hypothetical protein
MHFPNETLFKAHPFPIACVSKKPNFITWNVNDISWLYELRFKRPKPGIKDHKFLEFLFKSSNCFFNFKTKIYCFYLGNIIPSR